MESSNNYDSLENMAGTYEMGDMLKTGAIIVAVIIIVFICFMVYKRLKDNSL
ncbi:MAG: hypothetical protein LBQ02_00185 [Candidatus Nomurabacteria bacterium]|jgi:hypothetical protein|nr:hypothetical protein [Candidatus Nomurabacteria bacterium]